MSTADGGYNGFTRPRCGGAEAVEGTGLEIGNTLDASAVDELRELLKCRFPEVRRLAASALGKLAPRHPNEVLVVEPLAALPSPVAFGYDHFIPGEI